MLLAGALAALGQLASWTARRCRTRNGRARPRHWPSRRARWSRRSRGSGRRFWACAQVGRDDNFFELGGDSILSLQVVSRARRAGLVLTPRQLFEHQTVRGLAAVAGREAAAVVPETATGEAPLTPIQRWFFGTEIPAAAALEPVGAAGAAGSDGCGGAAPGPGGGGEPPRRAAAALHAGSGRRLDPGLCRALGAGVAVAAQRRRRGGTGGGGGRGPAQPGPGRRPAAAGGAGRSLGRRAAAAAGDPPPGGGRRVLAHPAGRPSGGLWPGRGR